MMPELRDELYILRRNLGPLRRGLRELASSPRALWRCWIPKT